MLVSVAAVAALHVVRPDLDPAQRRLSEYAVGASGWLMTLAFVAVAGGSWSLRRSIAAWPGLGPVRVLLAVAAVGMLASAAFETDVTTPAAPRELVHSAVSSTAFASLVLAMLWTSTVARAAIAWSIPRAVPDAVTAMAALGAVLGPIAHDGPWTGLVQRLTWLAVMVWLLLLTRAASRR